MKKCKVLLLAAAMGVLMTACGDTKEPADRDSVSMEDRTQGSTSDVTPGSTSEEETRESSQEESLEPENLPASAEYVSVDGVYKVVLFEGMTQEDMQLQAGSTMMNLDAGTARTGFTAVSLGSSKAAVPGYTGSMESLEDYADHITNMLLDGTGLTVSWEEADAPLAAGAVNSIARAGTAKSGMSRGQAYGYYAESEDCYFSLIIIGNDDDVEEARQIAALEVLGGLGERGTGDFINGMTAVLDSVNGANLKETYKMMVDLGADKSQLEMLASQARQSLSDSWGIENTEDLLKMADELISGLHNSDALALLNEYNGTGETDRDAFEAGLKEQNLEEETRISLLAAYDAWSAYGDGAIAAWDLSRVGTIMGFGYAGGYCTYEEAMDKMLEAAQKAQELYDSWEDFNKSYLYGYSYWAEESLEDAESSAAERAELVSSMESQAGGPFAMDWNMELKKEW